MDESLTTVVGRILPSGVVEINRLPVFFGRPAYWGSLSVNKSSKRCCDVRKIDLGTPFVLLLPIHLLQKLAEIILLGKYVPRKKKLISISASHTIADTDDSDV